MLKEEGLGGSDECKASVDRISALSDDLLGLILSLLTFKEAVATSILCCRWKYLWTLTPKLDFDGSKLLLLHDYDCERAKYVSWVDRAVAASSSPLEEFRVYLDLTRDCAGAIDDWLKLAFSRKVQRLELNLTDRGEMNLTDREPRGYDELYTFPYSKGNFPSDLSFIKKLSTHSVNVSGEALELFLGNCPLLEQLSVSGSVHLETLHVIGTFSSFKCLEISRCFNLTSVVVRDSSVVSFKYNGRMVPDFQLINVPHLTEIWVGGDVTCYTKHLFKMFSSVFPQIEIFKIYFWIHGICWEFATKFLNKAWNMMGNVKQLEVNTGKNYNVNDSLLPLTNIISASPNLERFVLEAPRMDCDISFLNRCGCFDGMLSRAYPRQLKEVEFVGYHGVECQVELIKDLVKNLAALESIVVDTRSFNAGRLDRPWERIPQPQNKAEMLARAYDAKKQLQMYVPSRINLKIL